MSTLWYIFSMLIGILIFFAEYFTYDIIIRDMVNILPHISFVSFFFIKQLIDVFVFNSDKASILDCCIKAYSNKNKDFAETIVEYKDVWKSETLYRIYKLFTIGTISFIYYFLFIDTNNIGYQFFIYPYVRIFS